MTQRATLTVRQLTAALKTLSGWKHSAGAIRKEFKFADFSAAFAFMVRVALAAERRNHHPDWSNSYNRVEVRLSTHDAGGVTALDIELAAEMDRLAGEIA